MSYEILEFHDVPAPIAKKLLEEFVSQISQRERIPDIIQSMLEYTKTISKCDSEKAEQLYSELKKMNLKEVTIAMIINIRPKIVDELRTLLIFEDRIPDEEVLKEIIDLLDKYCPLET